MRTFTLKSPDGKVVKGWGLSKFARENNLDLNLIGKVVNGEIWQHKGWTRPDKIKEDFFNYVFGSFTVKSPEGEIIRAKNIREFCLDYNLDRKYVVPLLNGHKKQYKGWTLP